MADTLMADISEFQTSFDAAAYLKAGNLCIIARTYNGSRPDNMMPARRNAIRAQPFTAVGWYCYLKASIDPAEQARGFIATVSTLARNEFPILDLEEGSGDQTARAQKFFDVVDKWAGFPCSLYSGASFLKTQLSGTGHWGKRPLWIASYPDSYSPNPSLEPAGCDWWQYTDRAKFAGLSGGVDGSVFRGSASEFLARVRSGSAPAPAPPKAIADDQRIVSIVKQDGRLEVFSIAEDGTVWHAYQTATNGGWAGAEAGKRNAAWYSLGRPGA
jgi:GH25 family lysozyme M1 (1,4-beta-N-acetylmuramidase)